MREIKNDCTHDKGYLFIIRYEAEQHWGTYTGSSPGSCYLYRYCRLCREQMGYLSGDEIEAMNNTEFSSEEVSEYFEKHCKIL
jgi:hypothetical protein